MYPNLIISLSKLKLVNSVSDRAAEIYHWVQTFVEAPVKLSIEIYSCILVSLPLQKLYYRIYQLIYTSQIRSIPIIKNFDKKKVTDHFLKISWIHNHYPSKFLFRPTIIILGENWIKMLKGVSIARGGTIGVGAEPSLD